MSLESGFGRCTMLFGWCLFCACKKLNNAGEERSSLRPKWRTSVCIAHKQVCRRITLIPNPIIQLSRTIPCFIRRCQSPAAAAAAVAAKSGENGEERTKGNERRTASTYDSVWRPVRLPSHWYEFCTSTICSRTSSLLVSARMLF